MRHPLNQFEWGLIVGYLLCFAHVVLLVAVSSC